jgi:threonine 3-dehydrogenase
MASKTMLAVFKARPEPGAELREVPIPSPGPGEALVKTQATSICGTDKHIYQWGPWGEERIKTPLIFGHECAGQVVELGADVSEVQVGDYVSVECHVFCNRCHQCGTGKRHICRDVTIFGVDFDGCFAEYFTVPARCLWKNDPRIEPEVACLQDPFGNATFTVSSCEVSGKTVAIVGDGPIGAYSCGVAKAFGARRIFGIGLVDSKLELMKQLGADHVINARSQDVIQEVRSATNGEGVDVALEMTGAPPAINQAIELLRRGGVMAAFGLPEGQVPINWGEGLIFKGITLHGINGREIFNTWEEMSPLLAERRVDPRPVTTHTFKLEQFIEAMETSLDTTINVGKVVLLP